MKTLLKKLLPKWLLASVLPTYHFMRVVIANVLNGFPARGLKVIAVTGTSGKTTTIHYIAKILQASGAKVGYSTSLGLMIGNEIIEEKQDTAAGPGTTRDPFTLQKLMRRMKRAKVDWVVLEVTSHALAQSRTWGIPIHTAVFTNLAPDHLDYHKTLENYMAAKAKLFHAAHNYAVLNHDDEHFEYFSEESRAVKKLTFGRGKDVDVRLMDVKLGMDGSELQIAHGRQTIQATIRLPGEFNAYNALAAASVGVALEIQVEAIQAGLESLGGLAGRMERLETTKGFEVLIDYAHAPDAFAQVFESVREASNGRLIAVFGGHVQHDYEGLGHEAGKGADVIVVTDDEPENGNPDEIRQTIVNAAKSTTPEGKDVQIHDIPDRREGMKKAFETAGPGDVVMLLGLGHQSYRRIGYEKIPWSEKEEAEKILASNGLLRAT